MSSGDLHLFLARAHVQDLHAAAREPMVEPGPADDHCSATSPVTLRFAFGDDAAAIGRLAALDSSEPPAMPALLCEVGGELRAVLSLADGAALADPFHPSAPLIELLRARARQLTDVRSVPIRSLRSIRAAFRARLRLQPHR